jgi:predicted RNase H-like HicB family nuclease
MELRYRVDIEPDEDGVFVATVPAFPGVVDQGNTEEEAHKNITEALDFTITDMIERGEEIPSSDAGRGVIREVDLVV